MRTPEPWPPVGCPGRQTLLDYHADRLADDESGQVAGHLAHCASCWDTLRSFGATPPGAGVGPNRSGSPRPRASQVAAPEWASTVTAPRAAVAADMLTTTAFAAELPDPATRGGARVGPYLLQSVLGSGGMGVVYKARHEQLNRTVALKMIRAGASADADALRRFATEGEAVARLEHPNVVQIYDFDQRDGVPYFTMEYVGGTTLAKKLAAGPLAHRDAATLVLTLATAVEYAHGRRVLHRDLKPANVLLGEDGSPKIADFGLAKLLDEGRDASTVTGAVLGTPSYMAPEQAEGRNACPLTDVYALGVILYETLTGRPPFVGASNHETMRLVREAVPPPPSSVRPGVPSELAEICLKCLEKSPSHRYSSAHALADDLTRWLGGIRPRHTPGRFRKSVKWLRRRRWPVAFATVAVGLLGVAYTEDPNRHLREMQADIARGQATTLIDDSGRARWLRWRTGEEGSRVTRSGGVLTIDCRWTVAVVELFPPPTAERYRFACQVRHTQCGVMGEVGIYAAHQAYPGLGRDIQFFTQLTFNDVRRMREVPIVINNRVLPLPINLVTLIPHLHSERGTPPNIDRQMGGPRGPEFRPAGEEASGWHDLEMVVDRGGVSASWDGIPIRMSTEFIEKEVTREMAMMRPSYVADPFVQSLEPKFTPRGGLGLYVMFGTASFRAATLTPLDPEN